MSIETQKFGALVRIQRKARGMSGRRLARVAGVSPATISKIETGMNDTAFDTAMRICHALQIDPRSVWMPQQGEPDWGEPVMARDTIEALAVEMARQIIDRAAKMQRQGRSW